MPAIKSNVNSFAAKALTGGGGPTSTARVDLRTAYGGIWQITITNNAANRLAKGVEVQAQVAPDQTAGTQIPFDCRRVAGQEKSEVTKFTIRIPPEPNFTLLEVKHGDEDATITATFTRIDQV